MSYNIGEFKGKKEVAPVRNNTQYTDTSIYFTRFAGGKERGTSLQITLENGSYIQLDGKTADELATLLANWRDAPEID